MAKRKAAAKRTLVDPTRGGKRFVRRSTSGTFKESDDVGRSLAQDVKKHAIQVLKEAGLADADKRLLAQVRATPPQELGTRAFPFRDPRYPELLFRYRARNWPETLNAGEHARWESFRQARLTRHTPLTGLTLDDYFARLDELRHDPHAQNKLALLDQLQAWGEQLAASVEPL